MKKRNGGNAALRAACIAGLSIVLVSTLTGCSANKGGDTTCGEFSKLSQQGKSDAIESFLKSKSGDEPANGVILLNVASASLYCSTVGSDSDPIKNIDG